MVSPQSASQVLCTCTCRMFLVRFILVFTQTRFPNWSSFIKRELSLLPLLHCGKRSLPGSVKKLSQEEIPQNCTRSSFSQILLLTWRQQGNSLHGPLVIRRRPCKIFCSFCFWCKIINPCCCCDCWRCQLVKHEVRVTSGLIIHHQLTKPICPLHEGSHDKTPAMLGHNLVGHPKQRKVKPDYCELLRFGWRTVQQAASMADIVPCNWVMHKSYSIWFKATAFSL